jgi:hypothetical protein
MIRVYIPVVWCGISTLPYHHTTHVLCDSVYVKKQPHPERNGRSVWCCLERRDLSKKFYASYPAHVACLITTIVKLFVRGEGGPWNRLLLPRSGLGDNLPLHLFLLDFNTTSPTSLTTQSEKVWNHSMALLPRPWRA